MSLYYALEDSDYTWTNALLWGNCIQHFKKAQQGSIGDRIVHVLIGLTELLPVVSQAASAIEKLVVQYFKKPSEANPNQHKDIPKGSVLVGSKIIPKSQSLAPTKHLIFPSTNQGKQDEKLTQWNITFKNIVSDNKDSLPDEKKTEEIKKQIQKNISTEHKKHRIDLYQSTQNACENGFYIDDKLVKLDAELTKSMIEGTKLSNPAKLEPLKSDDVVHKTVYEVCSMDTVDMAKMYKDKKLNPLALNMANEKYPGGGVKKGSGAQEESVFRRSNYYQALYPHAHGTVNAFYPIAHESIIYSPNVQIFRTKELDYSKAMKALDLGYEFHQPYTISFIAAAHFDLSKASSELVNNCQNLDHEFSLDSSKRPALEAECDKILALYQINENYEIFTKRKMRAILRTGVLNNHDSLVLGGLGCGAFKNPKALNAKYWNEVLLEDEFNGRFKKIGFAILKFGKYNELFTTFKTVIEALNN